MGDKQELEYPNQVIVDYLNRESNIGRLEEILGTENEKLRLLDSNYSQKMGGVGDFLDRFHLGLIMSEVRDEVNEFLDLDYSPAPEFYVYGFFRGVPGRASPFLHALASVGLASLSVVCLLSGSLGALSIPLSFSSVLSATNAYYSYFTKFQDFHTWSKNGDEVKSVISINPVREQQAIGLLSHEYSHAVLRRLFEGDSLGIMFHEGFARGVEKNISEMYSEKKNSPLYLYSITDSRVGEFKACYRWLCAEFDRSPNKDIMVSFCSNDIPECSHMEYYGMPSEHAVGCTAFALEESIKGNAMYSEFFSGKKLFDC